MYTKSSSSADSTYNSKWFAYKSMSFLIVKHKPRKTFDTNQINTVSCIKHFIHSYFNQTKNLWVCVRKKKRIIRFCKLLKLVTLWFVHIIMST
nr:unnamed protein product [Callosobruchus analis]